jgi:hypothetical protein
VNTLWDWAYKREGQLTLKHAVRMAVNIRNLSAAVLQRRYHGRIIILVYRIIDPSASQCSEIPNLQMRRTSHGSIYI